MFLQTRDVTKLESGAKGFADAIMALSSTIAEDLSLPRTRSDARLDAALLRMNPLVRQFGLFILRAQGLPLPEGVLPSDPALTRLALRLSGYQRQINLWGQIQALVRAQNPVHPRALYPEAKDPYGHQVMQAEVSDALFDTLHRMLSPANQGAEAAAHGCFSDIPLRNSEFLEHAHAARRVLLARSGDVRTRFLDVGCGAGFKVLSAAPFFDDVVGLEYDPTYIPVAERVLDKGWLTGGRIVQGDGLIYPDYARYDVVYFYRPMIDESKLRQLERKIARDVRPETILIAPYQMFARRYAELGCAHIAGSLFLAGSSQARADDLRLKAERIGNGRKVEPRPPIPLWEPVLLASRRNGFSMPTPWPRVG